MLDGNTGNYERKASELLFGDADFHHGVAFARDDVMSTHPKGHTTSFNAFVEELVMADRAMTFDQYVAAIQACAEVEGVTQRGVPYCEAEAWRESFNDGLTPSEAWSEEMLAAAEMLG